MNQKTEQQRKALTSAFLTNLELRRQLAEVDEGDDEIVVATTPEQDAAARAECARHCRPFDVKVEVGQVRVLSQTRELTYALVAHRWDARSWLVIPFSSYRAPATHQEMLSREDGGCGLRVLQLWNARSVDEALVAESWIAGTLSEEARTDAFDAWRAYMGAGTLTEDQLARTGLPIKQRDDPRWSYLDDALQNFAEFDARDQELSEKAEEEFGRLQKTVKQLLATARPFARASLFDSAAPALAAAPSAQPVSASCTLAGVPGTLHVRYLPAEKKLHLRAFDAAGERSSDLAGWQVFDAQGELLGAFEASDFVATLEGDFTGVLAVVDLTGKVYPLSCGENE